MLRFTSPLVLRMAVNPSLAYIMRLQISHLQLINSINYSLHQEPRLKEIICRYQKETVTSVDKTWLFPSINKIPITIKIIRRKRQL